MNLNSGANIELELVNVNLVGYLVVEAMELSKEGEMFLDMGVDMKADYYEPVKKIMFISQVRMISQERFMETDTYVTKVEFHQGDPIIINNPIESILAGLQERGTRIEHYKAMLSGIYASKMNNIINRNEQETSDRHPGGSDK